jgi:[ribosomal protein S18]-alanine N-acetyltransferase
VPNRIGFFMRIRDFQPADLPTLSKIDQECFPPGISYSREELAAFIAHRSARTWVAEDQGSIVGFVVASREPVRVGHIITIDVLEGSRRQGTGTGLMKVAEDWARKAGLQLIYLETAEDNVAAHSFYEARGYRKMDRVERYYNNGQAAWVMVKHLK